MCEKRQASQEVNDTSDESSRPVRIQSGRPIAARLARGIASRWEQNERDLFDVLRSVADRRGETPPSFSSAVQRSRNVRKDFRQPDLLEEMANASEFLTQQEMSRIDETFDTTNVAIRAILLAGMAEAFADGLDYAYRRMYRTARPQNPARFAEVPPRMDLDRNSPLFRAFTSQGLERITAKITVHFRAELYREIAAGLAQGDPWSRIADRVHARVGMGARWHWVRLVRTEIQSAYHYSARERAQSAGIEYEFLSVARTACTVCISARGYYRLGYGPTLPIHPNCRCTWIHYYDLPKGAQVRN